MATEPRFADQAAPHGAGRDHLEQERKRRAMGLRIFGGQAARSYRRGGPGFTSGPKNSPSPGDKVLQPKEVRGPEKKVAQYTEKAALKEWDFQFYVQAQLYMHFFDLTRHYLVCASPGGRDMTSCRTEYNKAFARHRYKKHGASSMLWNHLQGSATTQAITSASGRLF